MCYKLWDSPNVDLTVITSIDLNNTYSDPKAIFFLHKKVKIR